MPAPKKKPPESKPPKQAKPPTPEPQEPSKPGSPKFESPKPEPSKSESPKPEPSKSESPKSESRKSGSSKSEASAPQTTTSGPRKSGSQKSDAQQPPEPEPPEPEPPEPESASPGPEPEEPESETPEQALSPTQRAWHALRNPSRSQAVVAVLLAILGFAAVTQVRSIEADDTYEGRREEDLIEILNGVTGTTDRARREIAQLEQTRRNLETDSNARRAAIEQAEERLETLNILAGLVPVSGPGVRVTITEAETPVRVDRLLDLVQELRTAGAEAIEINDEVRLVAQSSFQEVDGRLEVDGVALDPPYVVEAIGEPNTLEGGVGFPSGPVAALRGEDGADVVIERPAEVVIESVRDLARTDFAEPAQGQ